ncbi:TonB-dependent receptor [Sphingomonas hengshuiensis]|uniref:TonB-dependent receptor n=1 Tax=Sphingomonas hengshuiensis TaxID=1609977 RepID=A0A7U4J9W1_9SPHN|nr:TonB-dependent receptor [Sphingomonas hengshuiensis]
MKFTASLSSIALAISFLSAGSAYAQEAEETVAPRDDVIVVTARKREEDILKTPVTLSVLTTEQIEKRSIVSLADVAAATPGFNINNNSSGRADRTIQALIIRGFTPSTVVATTVSTFIDGVPVSSPSALNSVGAAERIEVLRGPQSAYFGRNTFAGAVNVVNKMPTGEWAGSVTGMVGTRDNYRSRIELEGPIVGEQLTFRATYDRFGKDGSWINAADGGTLGDQESTSGSLLIAAKPAPGITAKVYASYSADRDGVSASTRISAVDIKDSAGNVIYKGQSNCTLNGNPFICGVLPSMANPVSSNRSNDALIRKFLSSPNGRVLDPEDGIQGYGMKRDYFHVHGALDVDLTPQLTASLLAGYNNERWSQFSDLDGYDSTGVTNLYAATGSRSYFDFPYLGERITKDYSVEGRLSYDSGALRGVVGVSLLDGRNRSSIGGGNGALGTTVFANGGGTDRAKTTGAFFGLTYDFTSALSVSLEGRYQIDHTYAYNSKGGTPIAAGLGSLIVDSVYKNFLPRAIINYQVDPNTMLYASFAKGVNPGTFSTGLISADATTQAVAYAAGITLKVSPEKVDNYELGMKGRTLGGALTYSLAGYYAKWRNQINSIVAIVPVTNAFFYGSANSGAVDLYGVEAQTSLRASDLVTFELAGAVNLSDIKAFTNRSLTTLTGISDFSGNEQPNSSKYSASGAIQLGGDVKGIEDTSWFSRLDWNFKSGVWSDQANIVRTPDRHVFNARVGVTKGNVSLEAFVTNLLNDKKYVSVYDNFMFTPTFAYTANYSALLVGLPELRTGGVQVKVKF